MLEERDPPATFAAAFDEAHETAAREAAASDFGPDDYRMGLRVLLQSLDYDTRFTERGRRIAWGMIINALRARAIAHREMAKIPDLDRLPIRRPLVITGIPRSGTTALHKLLALDPQFQGLQTWLVDAPMPRPPRETWASHPMFQRAVRAIQARYAASPNFRAAHNMVADEVHECILVLSHSFRSNLWTSGMRTPSYDAWWQSQSERPAYQYVKRVIQLIGSGESDKRWLLKNPGHIDNLDLLFEIFPDAVVVQTHRDPAKAVPSLCALFMQVMGLMAQPDDLEGRAKILGYRETAKWSNAVRKAERVRAHHPGSIMDVVHGEFHADPLGVIERIYDFADLELGPAVETSMRQRIQAKPESSHGKHRYDVANFGLKEEEIRASFGSYVDRYDLRLEYDDKRFGRL
jgi:hypothetical protein